MEGSHEDDIDILAPTDDKSDGTYFGVNVTEIIPEFYATTSANTRINPASFPALQNAYTDLKKRYNDLEQRSRIMQKALNDLEVERFDPQQRFPLAMSDVYDSNGIPSMAHAAGATSAAEPYSVETRARQGYASYLERELMKVKGRIGQLEMEKHTAESKYSKCMQERDRIHADMAVITESLDIAKEQHAVDREQLEQQIQTLDRELTKTTTELQLTKEMLESKNGQVGNLMAQMNDAGHFSLSPRSEEYERLQQKCLDLEHELEDMKCQSVRQTESEMSKDTEFRDKYRALEEEIIRLKHDNQQLKREMEEQSGQMKDRESPTDQMSLSAVLDVEDHKKEVLSLQRQVREQQELIQKFISHVTAAGQQQPLSPRPAVPGSSCHVVMSEQRDPASNIALPPTRGTNSRPPLVQHQAIGGPRQASMKASGPPDSSGQLAVLSSKPSEKIRNGAFSSDLLAIDSDQETEIERLHVQLPPPLPDRRAVTSSSSGGAVSKSYPVRGQEGARRVGEELTGPYYVVDGSKNTSQLTRTRSTPPSGSSAVKVSRTLSQSYNEFTLRQSNSPGMEKRDAINIPIENRFTPETSRFSPSASNVGLSQVGGRVPIRGLDNSANGSNLFKAGGRALGPMQVQLDQTDRHPVQNNEPIERTSVASRNVCHDDNTRYTKPVSQEKNLYDGWGALTVQVCPVCTQQFPQLTMDQFQTHVFECFDNVDDPPDTLQPVPPACTPEEDRQCPMCEAVFPSLIPHEEFERHVQEHFGEDGITDRFEILQP